MPQRWPAETDFAFLELDVLERDCAVCGHRMYICDHRHRRVHTLEGPLHITCKLNHCPDPTCPGHTKTKSPELESSIAPPQWAIGWDVLVWIGHRRFSRHWAITQIQGELLDSYGIKLSEHSITRYTQHYQTMLAARQQDPERLRHEYEGADEIILTIDGLQPEKGHEALYVVRELTRKRVWFAEALISATEDEVRRLIAMAKQQAEALGKTVKLWISDKQDAFVKGIAAEFPGVPHRYCANHFLRDLAKPVLEADSHAKVQMRRKVRGLRGIEKAVLKQQRDSLQDRSAVMEPESPAPTSLAANDIGSAAGHSAAEVVLDYSAAVRGILNDDQGGPFIHLVCGWPRAWRRSGSRSNGTWTRKKGIRGTSTGTFSRLHGPRFEARRRRARNDQETCGGNQESFRDPQSYDRELPATTTEIPAAEARICEDWRCHSCAYVKSDERLSGWSLRWRR